jgi:hypothetical protein
MPRAAVALLLALALLGAIAVVAVIPPAGDRSMRSFDPDRVADLELRMWQAYYAKQRPQLFGLLVVTLREQYHFSWATATATAFHLANAAATFGDATDHYETVLPDLETAFATVKAHSGASFDPVAVARAELAWWIARRIPGQNAPEQVGRLMADDYSQLYGAPLDAMLRPALLRSQAGALRDAQAQEPDWPTIGHLLTESYRALHESLADRAPAQTAR